MAKKKVNTTPSLFEESKPPALTPTLAEIVKERDNIVPPAKEAPVVGSNVKTSLLNGKEVLLRDGTVLCVGDETMVTDDILTGLLKNAHKDKTFIIEKMTPWKNCESGMLVIAYQKDEPEKKTTGIAGKGIDANWFKPVNEKNIGKAYAK